MASSSIYLSGAAKRKQRQIRNQNEAKSRATLAILKSRETINLSPKELNELCVKMILQIWMILHTLLLIWMREWLVKKLK